MKKISFALLLMAFIPSLKGQECFFLKNYLDTLFQVSPATGIIASDTLSPDFARQSIYAYLITIDPIGRRYIYVAPDDPSFSGSFSLKIVQVDSLQQQSIPLSNYAHLAIVNQFSFNGLEYNAIQDELYAVPVRGDSLYRIDMGTGRVHPVTKISNFASPYAYLHTFNSTDQQYAMIATDPQGNRRFYRVDLTDSTTKVSPVLTLPEPVRGLEYSEATGEYYFMSDQNQTFYKLDPDSGFVTPILQIPDYVNVWGYLHTYDFGADQYIFIGQPASSSDSLAIYSIFPATGNGFNTKFPKPALGYFGLEATNTVFINKLKQELTNSTALEVEISPPLLRVFPNPVREIFTIEMPSAGSIQLYHVTGQLIFEKRFTSKGRKEVSLSGIPAGNYYVRGIGQSGKLLGGSLVIKLP